MQLTVFCSEPEVPVSMIGRDFLTLKHFAPKEIHTLLWTAKDLKARYKGEIEKVSGEQVRYQLVLNQFNSRNYIKPKQ